MATTQIKPGNAGPSSNPPLRDARRALRTFVVAEAGQTLKEHACGLLVGAALGLLLCLLWKWWPLGLYMLVFLSDERGGHQPGD